jgi:thiamine-monophosphate kinase
LHEASVDQPDLTVRDVGEFGLIARLQADLETRLGLASNGAVPGLVLGIGDDAAIWEPTPGAQQVVTTDALVEDVHFRLGTTSWSDLGWKALAVNVSDIAAMGARPRHALVTLGLTPQTRLADLRELYRGLAELAERFDLSVIGGDVVSAPVFVLSVTVIGESNGPLLRRDAGRPGDLVAVTGALGASMGGLRLLEQGSSSSPEADRLRQAHLRPLPRVAEGQALVRAGLRCAMDLSDGLLGDTTRLCERSGVGALLEAERVPVDPALLAAFGGEARSIAIAGGEDYELLCAGPPAALDQARSALAALDTPLTVVGRLIERPAGDPAVRLVDALGQPFALAAGSWDHFRG